MMRLLSDGFGIASSLALSCFVVMAVQYEALMNPFIILLQYPILINR